MCMCADGGATPWFSACFRGQTTLLIWPILVACTHLYSWSPGTPFPSITGVGLAASRFHCALRRPGSPSYRFGPVSRRATSTGRGSNGRRLVCQPPGRRRRQHQGQHRLRGWRIRHLPLHAVLRHPAGGVLRREGRKLRVRLGRYVGGNLHQHDLSRDPDPLQGSLSGHGRGVAPDFQCRGRTLDSVSW